jgi:hypothetical protein
LAFRLGGWLLRVLGIDSPSFSMPPNHLRKGYFSVQKMGSTTGFAREYRLSLLSVRNWEQRRRLPRGPAKTLLELIAKEPEAIGRIFDDITRPQGARPRFAAPFHNG